MALKKICCNYFDAKPQFDWTNCIYPVRRLFLNLHNNIRSPSNGASGPSPLISWVNPFPSRFINRTACFPRKVSYFRESRMSPWKKWSWMKSNSEARPSTVFLFYYTSIFTILQPLGSGYHEIKVNELPDWDWAWSDGTKATNWGSRKGYLCEFFFFFCRHTSHI